MPENYYSSMFSMDKGVYVFFQGYGAGGFFAIWQKNFVAPQNCGKKFRGPPKFRNKIWWPPKIPEKNFTAPQTSKACTIHRSSFSMTLFGAREVRHHGFIPYYLLSTALSLAFSLLARKILYCQLLEANAAKRKRKWSLKGPKVSLKQIWCH